MNNNNWIQTKFVDHIPKIIFCPWISRLVTNWEESNYMRSFPGDFFLTLMKCMMQTNVAMS